MDQLLLIESAQPTEMDRAMLRLADWMGVKTTVITHPSHSNWMEQLKQTTQDGHVCIAASAETLAQLSELFVLVHAMSEFAAERSVSMLIYGIGGSSSHITLMKRLGCRAIDGVHHIQKQPLRFRFSTKEKACLQQLAGLEFSEEVLLGCDVFQMDPSAKDEVAPLLFAEDHPVFVHAQVGRGNIGLYLWATNQIADVGALAPRGARPESMYQWLLPAIIYLKACFGSSCWHNPNARARLIIDDPLLHPQYGFLRYDALLHSMRRVSYGTSLLTFK